MLNNKVTLVTGTVSGIGRTLALVGVRKGARLERSDLNVCGGRRCLKQVRATASASVVPTHCWPSSHWSSGRR